MPGVGIVALAIVFVISVALYFPGLSGRRR
jgi:hypothetical protein